MTTFSLPPGDSPLYASVMKLLLKYTVGHGSYFHHQYLGSRSLHRGILACRLSCQSDSFRSKPPTLKKLFSSHLGRRSVGIWLMGYFVPGLALSRFTVTMISHTTRERWRIEVTEIELQSRLEENEKAMASAAAERDNKMLEN